MSIIVSKNRQNPKRLDESRFEAESDMQEFVFDIPDVVPINEIEEGARFNYIY